MGHQMGAVATATDIVIASVTPTETGGPVRTLTVTGRGFRPDAQIVIGRGPSAVVPLATVVIDDETIEAELSPNFVGRAEDLIVAVATADGTGERAIGATPVRRTNRPMSSMFAACARA